MFKPKEGAALFITIQLNVATKFQGQLGSPADQQETRLPGSDVKINTFNFLY